MRPTAARDLLGAAAVGGLVALAVVLARRGASGLPRLPTSVDIGTGVLALVELLGARAVRRRRLGHGHPLDPLVAARVAAGARASSLVAALLVGVWAVLLVDRLTRLGRLSAAGRDAAVAGVGAATAIMLTAAALRLERSLRLRD